MFENYEGTAIDTSMFSAPEVEPSAEPITVDDNNAIDTPDESAAIETVEPSEEALETDEPTVYEIEGVGTFTAEDIKNLQQGSLRQSDYTKKTQELARQREELKDAKELYDYLKANPQLVDAMRQAEQNPNSVVHTASPTYENQMLKDIVFNQRALEADIKMNELKSKYGDVDEIAIYQKAAELKTDDFEFVYKALNYNKVDAATILEQAKAQLKAELEKDKNSVSTIVDTKQTSQIQKTTNLTDAEKRIASMMGMTEDEYAKWK